MKSDILGGRRGFPMLGPYDWFGNLRRGPIKLDVPQNSSEYLGELLIYA